MENQVEVLELEPAWHIGLAQAGPDLRVLAHDLKQPVDHVVELLRRCDGLAILCLFILARPPATSTLYKQVIKMQLLARTLSTSVPPRLSSLSAAVIAFKFAVNIRRPRLLRVIVERLQAIAGDDRDDHVIRREATGGGEFLEDRDSHVAASRLGQQPLGRGEQVDARGRFPDRWQIRPCRRV